jgi:hypothetical protein
MAGEYNHDALVRHFVAISRLTGASFGRASEVVDAL